MVAIKVIDQYIITFISVSVFTYTRLNKLVIRVFGVYFASHKCICIFYLFKHIWVIIDRQFNPVPR